MEQYLEALKQREEVAQEVIVELEERFKEPVEEPVEVIPVPTLEERLQALELMELERILGGM